METGQSVFFPNISIPPLFYTNIHTHILSLSRVPLFGSIDSDCLFSDSWFCILLSVINQTVFKVMPDVFLMIFPETLCSLCTVWLQKLYGKKSFICKGSFKYLSLFYKWVGRFLENWKHTSKIYYTYHLLDFYQMFLNVMIQFLNTF